MSFSLLHRPPHQLCQQSSRYFQPIHAQVCGPGVIVEEPGHLHLGEALLPDELFDLLRRLAAAGQEKAHGGGELSAGPGEPCDDGRAVVASIEAATVSDPDFTERLAERPAGG